MPTSVANMSEPKTGGSAVDASETSVYEIGYHLIPTLDEEARARAVDTLRRLIEGSGAAIVNETYPELIELSYSMSHTVGGSRRAFSSAYFGWMFVRCPKEAIQTIENAFRRCEGVLRFIVVTTTIEHAMATTTYSFKKELLGARAGDVEERSELSIEQKQEELSEEEVDKAIEELIGEEAK